jgi:hypothetical protein
LKHPLLYKNIIFLLFTYTNIFNIPPLKANEFLPYLLANKQSTNIISPSQVKDINNVIFVESSIEKGIIFKHEERDFELSSLRDTLGSGICIIDIDNDGFEDVFSVGGRGVTRRYGKQHWWNKTQGSKLYQNVNGTHFIDVTKNITISGLISGYGCATGDLNNDGYADLVIGGYEQLTVLLNQNGHDFIKQTIALAPNTWPMSITLWDANKDGYLDILVANFAQLINDIKVGTQDYGYQSHGQFQSHNFFGQQNIILTSIANKQTINSVSFLLTNLADFSKSFSIVPLALIQDDSTITHNTALLIANAKGSTSLIQAIKTDDSKAKAELPSWLSNLTVPLIQVSSINILNDPAILLTQHKTGGYQLYITNQSEADDLSWQSGINSEKDNVTPSWATLVADFNNDGLEDIVSANGFSTPHIDNPFRPQGSLNTFKIQTTEGNFSEQNVLIQPNLARSSKGAAFADFNNDGLLDVAFNNNNNHLSLYINKSSEKKWLSLICEPLYLCEGSAWQIVGQSGKVLTTSVFSKSQPFLSSNQKRLHFAFNDIDEKVNISLRLQDNTQQYYAKVTLNDVYRINIKNKTIAPIEKLVAQQILSPSLTYLANAPIDTLLPLLAQMSPLSTSELTTLADYLLTYKLSDGFNTTTQSPEFITLTSWLLNQALQNNQLQTPLIQSIIRLIGRSESALFADHIVYLLDQLQDESFCVLAQEIHQWFWEEEAATKSKQLFKAPLMYKVLNSNSAQEVICGLNAIAVSRDTTLGYSLLTLLSQSNLALSARNSVQAATVRTLGFLKNKKVRTELIAFCKAANDPLIIAECLISLDKLDNHNGEILHLFTMNKTNSAILTLHTDNIILAPLLNALPQRTEKHKNMQKFKVNNYLSSPMSEHATLAHLINLTSAKNENDKLQAITKLLSNKNMTKLSTIANRWHSFSPTSIDSYFFLAGLPQHKLHWLLPFASNKTIKHLLLSSSQNVPEFNYHYALVKQCKLRQSIKSICQTQLSITGYLTMAELEVLLDKSIMTLMYALLSDNITRQKTTATLLFNYSLELVNSNNRQNNRLELIFSLLRIDDLYTLFNTNQVTSEWLSQFVLSTQKQRLTLNKPWLERHNAIMDLVTKERAILISSTK